VATAVARAAIESGAARRKLDLDAYRRELEARLGKSRELMRVVLTQAQWHPKRVVLAEGDDEKMIRAAYQLVDEGIAHPVLVGDRETIWATANRLGLDFGPEIVDPGRDRLSPYADRLYELRNGKGVTWAEASDIVRDGNYLGSVMVEMGDADAMLTGMTHHYPTALRAPLQVIGTADDAEYAAGVYMLTLDNRVVFCADTTVTQDPSADALAEVTKHTAAVARQFNVEPRAALLSYSDFGSVRNRGTRKPRRAADRLRTDPDVDFPVDGEMQADTALVEDMLTGEYDFTGLDAPANVFVFPNLEAGNIGYKLLQRLGGADAIGPMLAGMDRPVHVMQRGDEVEDIVNLAGVAVVDAQE
jgi:malate dehydrogenase (oxaloacetate-decarboxylating)(NADP+)